MVDEETKTDNVTNIDTGRKESSEAQTVYAGKGVYFFITLPRSRDEIPEGHVLVHNHMRPSRQLETRDEMPGFRVWHQPLRRRIEKCPCKWAPELGVHYRRRGMIYRDYPAAHPPEQDRPRRRGPEGSDPERKGITSL
jgi:hypothetical protein